VSPLTATLAVGGTQLVTAQGKDASGNSLAATFNWQSTNGTVASVSATGLVTANAPGTASITASSGSVHSSAAIFTVSGVLDNTPWPTTGATGSSIIAAAVAQGALTAEQGLVYRVYSAFEDPRLPGQYRGAADHTPDNSILLEASSQYAALSPATHGQGAVRLLEVSSLHLDHALRDPLRHHRRWHRPL
jgi:hypothetical protein